MPGTPLSCNIEPNRTRFSRALLYLVLALQIGSTNMMAQTCPPNIDFEAGTFNNWTCYTGNTAAVNGQNVITLSTSGGPVFERHTMFSAIDGAASDFFGGFPVNCPNGSGHSVKLGNNRGGGQAEGISYEFTIPANQDKYSLIYHYAVVFQDPNHETYQQPRLVIEATNTTDNELISCSSFTFYPYGSILPGFFISPNQQDTTNVWCKNWTAVTLNLNGMAGKAIKLLFKTADCTFNRHFGYAYIDVDSDCNSEFVGATYCPDDTAVQVTAPFGYQNYTWFSNNFTQVLGNGQIITFAPPPPSGTIIAVEVVPYDGYGCRDTFYAALLDTLRLRPDAGADQISCNNNPVMLGANPKLGVVYNWSPATGLSNPYIANPRAGPDVTTQYVLTVRSFGGGCVTSDTVIVTASITDTALRLIGKDKFCITNGDSAVLEVNPTSQIQWYKGNVPISGATGVRYRVRESGSYHAVLVNERNCTAETVSKEIIIDAPVPAVRYPVKNAVNNIPMPLSARNIGTTALWNPATFLNNPQSFTPRFTGTEEKLYTIAITSRAGCVTVDTQFVKVFKEINIYVPSAFTPNKDGLNDFLIPVPTGIVEFRYFRVFNRWGQLLYTLTNESPGWDGTFKGVLQPMQNVVWMAEGVGADGIIHRKRGTTVLIR
jgi:gliding motility-associated-like protein